MSNGQNSNGKDQTTREVAEVREVIGKTGAALTVIGLGLDWWLSRRRKNNR